MPENESTIESKIRAQQSDRIDHRLHPPALKLWRDKQMGIRRRHAMAGQADAATPPILWWGWRCAVSRTSQRDVPTYFCWLRRLRIGFAFKLIHFEKHGLSG